MTTDPQDHDRAVAQLQELIDRNRLAPARAMLANVLPQYPDSVALLQCAVWVDWLGGNLDAAMETLDRVLKLDPDNYQARFQLSGIQADREQYADAEKTVLDLLSEFPDVADLYAHYARIMLHTYHIEKAQRLAAEALRRDPDNETALNVDVVCAFITSPGAEHRERLQRLLRQYPDQAESTIRIVQLLIDNGKHREAYELSRELVQLDPGNEGLVELASGLRHATHWSLIPLWPMRKWGWGGSIGLWFLIITLTRSNILASTPLAGYEYVIALIFVVYVIYSWVWPPVLARILR